METTEDLQRENEELKRQNIELSEATLSIHQEQGEWEAQSNEGTNAEELEKKRLHDELCSLVDKYEKMAQKMEGSSSFEQLLNHTNLPYSVEVKVVPLPLKLAASKIDMCDGSQDPVDHLENFKAHITLHGFPGEIACRVFLLTLKVVVRGWLHSVQTDEISAFSFNQGELSSR